MTPPTPSEPNPQVLRTVAVRPRYGQQRNAQDWLLWMATSRRFCSVRCRAWFFLAGFGGLRHA